MTESAAKKYLRTDEKGTVRCWWCGDDAEYQRYHDKEWGRPVKNDFRLFEKICLEGFQSGLSWLTILRKRENFRHAFDGFDFTKVAKFNDRRVEKLLLDEGIIRHRGKIEATINNAQKALEIAKEFDSLAKYIWQWEPDIREPDIGKTDNQIPNIPNVTQTSTNLSRDLKKRGWKFFGPTTAYAFMQACGLVNDHLVGCKMHKEVDALRTKFKRP